MNYPVPENLPPLDTQPVEFVEEVACIYFRSILLARAGHVVPQHSHGHDHATYVGAGAARLWVDGKWVGDYPAGHAVEIKADRAHVFQALQDNTRLACVHDVSSAESMKMKGV